MRLFRCPCYKTRPTRIHNHEQALNLLFFCLDEGQLVGSDVESIDIGCQAGVSLLGTVGAENS